MTDALTEFFNRQLTLWPQAAARYDNLKSVEQRVVNLSDFPVVIQHNPARAVSTTAKTDAASISKRPCFLCPDARPQEQIVLPYSADYEILVNPFPIFPRHFTIVSTRHQNQDNLDAGVAAEMAMMYPGYVFFYNGAHSGASAPDHLHLQAVPTQYLPILKYSEELGGSLLALQDETEIRVLEDLPMHVLHFTGAGFTSAMKRWSETLLTENDLGLPDTTMRNILWWKGREGRLHTLFFPRRAHRPNCYTSTARQLLISPGAIDMAGVLIAPRKEDFDSITRGDIRRIYDDVSFRFQDSPLFKKLLMP